MMEEDTNMKEHESLIHPENVNIEGWGGQEKLEGYGDPKAEDRTEVSSEGFGGISTETL